MRRFQITLALIAVVGCAGGPLSAQGRRFDPVPIPSRDEPSDLVPEDLAPPLPTRARCEEGAGTIAAAYGPDGLEEVLHESFPNRDELLDALHRLDLRVTGIALEVESIESARVLPWRIAERRPNDTPGTLTADCVVDIRTRLHFDDPETGERTVSDPVRAEWRLRFTATVRESRAE